MKRTLFFKTLFSIIVVFLILGVVIVFVSITRTSQLLEEHLIEEGKAIAKIISKEIETGYLAHRLPFEALVEIKSHEVLFYWVVEPSGRIYLADDPKMWGLKIEEPSLGTKKIIVKDSLYYKTGEKIKLIVCPLNIGEPGKPWTFYLGISQKSVIAARKATIFRAVGIFFASIFFAILFSALLTGRIIRPLRKLTAAAEEIAKGKLDKRVQIKTGDEIEDLANSFNKMTAELQGLYATLEKKVQERTAELQKANKELKETYMAVLNISEDLKETKDKLEEANQKLKETEKMRKEFGSHTAHELRTPLNVFRWSVEMLRHEDLGKINLKQREILDQVYESNQRLLTLVDDLLEISRIDEVRLKIKTAPCQIEDLIDSAAGQFAVEVHKKNIYFVWQKPKKKLPKVKADPERLTQILLNILSNAVKYNKEGGKIEIKTEITDKIAPEAIREKYGFVQKDKKYVLVSISDTGLGIPKAEQEKMFTRFFRGSNVARAQIEGTGLGMTLVFELVKMHDGAIWFESEEGAGTTFYFTLPVA
jgi:signal transduction histidine kinase